MSVCPSVVTVNKVPRQPGRPLSSAANTPPISSSEQVGASQRTGWPSKTQGRKNSRPGGKSCGQPAIVIWKETRKLAEELACDSVQYCSCLAGGSVRSFVECAGLVRGHSGASGEGHAVPCALRAARI
jgi:hypothetical protein